MIEHFCCYEIDAFDVLLQQLPLQHLLTVPYCFLKQYNGTCFTTHLKDAYIQIKIEIVIKI